MNQQDTIKMYEVEKALAYTLWASKMPQLRFPSNWVVRIVPPYAGAMVRFYVAKKRKPDKEVSIYFDAYNNLGFMPGPYWEMYPAADGDTARFLFGEEAAMMKAIKRALK